MLGWIKTLTKKFGKLPAIAQFVAAILIMFVIRYLLHLVIYSNYLSSYLENFGNPKELVYFHMNGCGHCKTFTPIWDDFAGKYNGDIKLKKLERNEAGDMLDKYQVQGFPTILLLDEQGNKKVFEGDRTVSGLESFISQ
uniref:Thioredoxin domain-containing protein n=1 Tax=viral metagenome TaxID=1070528 RepID=A0A6C0JC08_9ZZZZ|tara:strand:- start:4296 stop:4712 length:417 start_codon:yes stop_codon:yes gene_type:complete